MTLAPVEKFSPTFRFAAVCSRNMYIHKFEQAWTFLTQFKGDVGRQLDRWRLKEWVQPVNDCLEVDEFLNSLRHYGTADITMEFPVQG